MGLWGGDKSRNDPTVGLLCAADLSTFEFWILDIWRRRLTPDKIRTSVFNKAITDGPNCRVLIEQEPGASGKAVVNFYETEVLPRFRVQGIPAVRSKADRAHPFLAAAEAGNVWILERDWNIEFIEEFSAFPDGKHDDQIDCCAMGYNELLGKRITSPFWGVHQNPARALARKKNSRESYVITGACWRNNIQKPYRRRPSLEELADEEILRKEAQIETRSKHCLLYTSPSPRERQKSRMPSSA